MKAHMVAAAALLVGIATFPMNASADFYKDKRLTVLVNYAPGRMICSLQTGPFF